MENQIIGFNRRILLLLMIFYSYGIFSQSNNFIQTLSTGNDQTISTALEIPHEGFILSTSEKKANKVIQKFIKINLLGDTVMSYSISSVDSNAWVPLLMRLQDGTIMGIGIVTSIQNGGNKIWLIRIDNDLNILQEKKYEVPFDIFKIGSCYDHFGNIIVNGFFNTTNNIDEEDVFVFRLSVEGDSLHYSRLQYPGTQMTAAIMEKLDNSGYYMPILGRMTSQNLYLANMVELDFDFNITFEDSITNDVGVHNNIRKFNDNQYLLSGQTYLPFMPYVNEFIAVEKLDKDYHANNYQRVGPYLVDTVTYPAWFKNMDFVDTNNVFIGGTVNISMYANPNQNSYLILANLDSELNKQWQYFYGFDKYYEMHGILATQDGGCLILATIFNFIDTDYERDILLIKVDSNGLITGTNSEPEFKISNAIIYPNPGIEYLNIQSGPQITGAEFYMFDMHGKAVLSEKINNTQLKVNTAYLPSATYPWHIVFKNKVIESGKWVKK